MKFKITLKDPDGVDYSFRNATEKLVEELDLIDPDEVEMLIESRLDKLHEACSKWVKYNEYVTIEIDTETGEACVCPVK